MRRRRLFTIAAGASALLTVATVAMWVRSERVADAFDWQRSTERASVGSAAGAVFYDRIRVVTAGVSVHHSRGPGYHAVPLGPQRGTILAPNWSFAGFSITRQTLPPVEVLDVRVPYWFVTLLGIAPAGLCVWARWRIRDALPGRCSRCGYDLRATPERCPECGVVPAKGAT